MSSRDLSRVVALSCKASELEDKGYYARALEKNAAAIAAAQELAQEDCLVVTHLQRIHRSALRGYAETPGVSPEAASAKLEQESQTFLAAFATLERRKAAGTLLPGNCRKWPEEEWYGHSLQHRRVLNTCQPFMAEDLAILVQLVGYDAYLDAASDAVFALKRDLRSYSSLVLACVRFAVSAIDLFEQPRPKIWTNCSLVSEVVMNA
jgi:hypothetical protein